MQFFAMKIDQDLFFTLLTYSVTHMNPTQT